MQHTPDRWLIADVETTGVRTEDRVVEIAWIEVDNDLNIVDEVHSLIDPEMPIPAAASGVHHITDAMVADAPTISQFFEIVRGRNLGSYGLIAHNAAFDRRFLEPHSDEILSQMCTLRLARRLYPDLDNHKLQTLRYTFELDAGRAHSALGDITALASFVKMLREVTALSLHGLAQLAMQPIEVKTMPFGKHKGQLLEEVPRSYMSWLLKQSDVDPDLRASMENYLAR